MSQIQSLLLGCLASAPGVPSAPEFPALEYRSQD